jgi:hypothetical protein
MKTDIQTLQDLLKIGYEAYEDSRNETMRVFDMYHNRQFTDEQLAVLEMRGQPKETFNIIKAFGRMLLGYYSTVVNTVKVDPKKEPDIITAEVLNDLVDYVFRTNNFNSEGDKLKLDMILAGFMCSYTNVKKTGETDEFGRPKYEIEITHVPALEVILDPLSRKDDYSDARYIHRFKWISEGELVKRFGSDKLDKIEAYHNHLDIDEAEFSYSFNAEFRGKYKQFDNYLVVHTIITDDDDKTWSIFWCGDVELSRKEVTYKEVKNPYRVFKLHSSNKTEHYGIFREVIETQHAINQAVIKIQLMVNTQKAFVEKTAVDDMATFETQFNRVNAIIPVKSLQGIRVENLAREVLDQYTIIDKALDRVQRILAINDSFLGMAYASDSGSKVKLQQNASVIALRYLTLKVEQFYRLLGWDIVNLIKQYFTAHDVLRVVDTYEGNRWVEINKPLLVPSGNINPMTGQPEARMVFEEVLSPEDNEPLTDEMGNIIMAPIPTMDTEIAFTQADVSVSSVAYNDEDERNQVMLEQFINGPMGTTLSQVNPAGYFKAGALAMKNTRSKYSMELSAILEQTGQMMQQGANPQAQQQMMMGEASGQMTPDQAMNQLPNRPSMGGR